MLVRIIKSKYFYYFLVFKVLGYLTKAGILFYYIYKKFFKKPQIIDS